MTLKQILDKIKEHGVKPEIVKIVEPRLTVSLWENQQRGERSPCLKGYVVLNGTQYPIVLWHNQSETHKAPQYVGGLNKLSTVGVTQA